MTKTLLAVAALALFHLTAPAQDKTYKLSDMNWLAGCWESRDVARRLLLSEQWMAPAGGLMLGMGRTVESDKAVDFEVMRIEQNGTALNFIARPRRNKDETPFKIVRSRPFEAVFENLEHDFPQRVMYRRNGRKLFARIEGIRDGKIVGMDFPMVKVACD